MFGTVGGVLCSGAPPLPDMLTRLLLLQVTLRDRFMDMLESNGLHVAIEQPLMAWVKRGGTMFVCVPKRS